MPNRLISSSSPYLLQHANNPVDWFPWSEEAWEKARKENKLVLVSIGYSACHWCHVMERESFEDEATARLMNESFVCIKVDREERPDVDQVYMSAVQLMTSRGGWPLNCFTLPDGKPLYGGTYFPNHVWKDLLEQLERFYRIDPDKARQYARELTEGIQRMESVVGSLQDPSFQLETAKTAVENWSKLFDTVDGGPNRAPKFPLPNNYLFLLHYGTALGDQSVLDHVRLTLLKMACGGIYDQVGGGFCRYSVDSHWKVPHFEKMLYDNAQLISLYSKAYQWSREPLYREIVEESLAFIERELMDASGLCYAALDADSEGIEGKFYTWTKEELDEVQWPAHGNLPVKAIAYDHFSFDERGHWEHGRHIPLRAEDVPVAAAKFGIEPGVYRTIISDCRSTLLAVRNRRIRPGLDNKLLLSWNALMISAWCHAADALGLPECLSAAVTACDAIENHLRRSDGSYVHCTTPGKTASDDAPVFLEDLAAYGEALIDLYTCTFKEEYLERAHRIADLLHHEYYDPDTSLCWYTPESGPALIARKREIQDNVIPSSNSIAAKFFFRLGQYYGDTALRERSEKMLQCVVEEIPRYGSAYSNWAQLHLWLTLPFHELVLTGPESMNHRSEITRHFLPSVLIAGDPDGSTRIPLCADRYVNEKSLMYLCQDRTCQLPTESIAVLLETISKH